MDSRGNCNPPAEVCVRFQKTKCCEEDDENDLECNDQTCGGKKESKPENDRLEYKIITKLSPKKNKDCKKADSGNCEKSPPPCQAENEDDMVRRDTSMEIIEDINDLCKSKIVIKSSLECLRKLMPEKKKAAAAKNQQKNCRKTEESKKSDSKDCEKEVRFCYEWTNENPCDSYENNNEESDDCRSEVNSKCQKPRCKAENTCCEECCCLRDSQKHSSSNKKRKTCDSFPREPQRYICYKIDCNSNNTCACAEENDEDDCQEMNHGKSNETSHSACTCCSRNCSPSKASMFVEIGGSSVDFCVAKTRDSRGNLEFYGGSCESLGNDMEHRCEGAVRRNKSESKCPQKAAKKCNMHCKARQSTVGRSCSDEFPPVQKCCAREEKSPCSKIKNVCSSTIFRRCPGSRGKTGSKTCLDDGPSVCKNFKNKDVSFCPMQKNKMWSQVQDAYKNAVKMATSSFVQTIKEFTKPKCSKKCQRALCTFEKDCMDISNEKCSRHSMLCDKCMHQNCTDNDMRCYQATIFLKSQDENAAEDNRSYFCTKDSCQHYHNMPEQTQQARSWCYDPDESCNGENEHFQPCGGKTRKPLKGVPCPKYAETRSRGGSDRNSYSEQKRKRSNSQGCPNRDTFEAPRAANNRTKCMSNHPYVNKCIQVSTVCNNVEDTWEPPSLCDNIARQRIMYQKEARPMKQVGTYPAEISEDGDVQKDNMTDVKQKSRESGKHHTIPSTQVGVKALETCAPDCVHRQTISEPSHCRRISPRCKDPPPTKPVEKKELEEVTDDKHIQCQIIERKQVICVKVTSKLIHDEVDAKCLCKDQETPRESLKETDVEIKEVVSDKTKEDSVQDATEPSVVPQVDETTIPSESSTNGAQQEDSLPTTEKPADKSDLEATVDESADKSNLEETVDEPAYISVLKATFDKPSEKSDLEATVDESADKSDLEGTVVETADKSDLKATVDESADKSDLEAAVVETADKSDLEATVDEPSEKSDLEATVDESADKSDLEGTVDESADKSDLEATVVETADKKDLEATVDEPADKSDLEATVDESADKSDLEETVDEPAYISVLKATYDEPSEKSDLEATIDESADKSDLEATVDEPADKSDLEATVVETADKSDLEATVDEPADKSDLEATVDEPADKSDLEATVDESADKSDLEATVVEPADKSDLEATVDETADKSDLEATADESLRSIPDASKPITDLETSTPTEKPSEDAVPVERGPEVQVVAGKVVFIPIQTKDLKMEPVLTEPGTLKELSLMLTNQLADLVKVDLAQIPIDLPRGFTKHRTYFDVDIQTPDTLVTKIFSEAKTERGEKKKHVLMSIRFQLPTAEEDKDEMGDEDETGDKDETEDKDKAEDKVESKDVEVQTPSECTKYCISKQSAYEERMFVDDETNGSYDESVYMELPSPLCKGRWIPRLISESSYNMGDVEKENKLSNNGFDRERNQERSMNATMYSNNENENENGTVNVRSRNNSTLTSRRPVTNGNICAGPCGRKKNPPQ